MSFKNVHKNVFADIPSYNIELKNKFYIVKHLG